MVILDTNIIIDHLRRPFEKSKLRQIEEKIPLKDLAISIITVQELYEGKSTRDEVQERTLLETINPLAVLPYTYEVAQIAGKLARDLSRRTEFPDAAIAATTILNKASLFTLNKKDFKGVKKLKLI